MFLLFFTTQNDIVCGHFVPEKSKHSRLVHKQCLFGAYDIEK